MSEAVFFPKELALIYNFYFFLTFHVGSGSKSGSENGSVTETIMQAGSGSAKAKIKFLRFWFRIRFHNIREKPGQVPPYYLILSYYYQGLGVGSTVTMRRSASVPCKRDRDSISSGN
jgi:hypothetical protein